MSDINIRELKAMRAFHGLLRQKNPFLQPLTTALETTGEDPTEGKEITLPFEVLAPRKVDSEQDEKKHDF
jgi:hypothetical protein